MSYPRGIATDGTNVYVADWDNQRIDKFGVDGSYVASWTIGSPQQKPQRVAVAGGKVYVTTFSNAAWRFDTSGVPDPTWDGDGKTGTSGTGAGQLEYPVGVAVDGGGVYVVDSNNERIAQFDLNGAFVRAWGWGVADGAAALQTCTSTCQEGIIGSGTGQFSDPYAIVAAGGKVWVADAYNHRIQQFTAAGAHLATVGGLPGGKFYFPDDVAIGPAGDVYVADYSASRIQRLSPAGSFLSMWTTPYPVSVTPANGNFYATTIGNHVRRYDSGGTLLGEWGSAGTLPGQFNNSYGTAADAAGNIYVADRGNNRVQKFDPSGNSLALIGTGGSGDGQLKQPRDVAIDADGNIYVADTGNSRVEKFDASGAFVRAWGQAGTPTGIVVDARGHVFVSDSGNDRIEQFDRDGQFVAKWGDHGSGLGQLDYPEGLAVDAAGAVWVADDDNHRIARFCCPGAASEVGSTQGSGGSSSTGSGASAGGPDTVAPRITLGGRRTQRAATVRRGGLRVRIGSDEAAQFSLTATPSRRDARRLGLRTSIGRARGDLPAGGTRTLRIRLSAHALKRSRVLRVVVRARAVDRAGNRSAKSLALTIRR
jgi:tripartite motif-containing protein 71